MELSQFELVYKPQSPAGPADTVVQGYFLEITNLEDEDLSFSLTFTTSPVSDPDRSLFGNAAVFVDTPGVNNNLGVFTLTGGLTSSTFGLNRRIFVPANGTALVALLPSDPFPPALVPGNAANFECRGFVRIFLPAVFRALRLPSGQTIFTRVSQADGPQKVLITAQNRALYTDPDTGEAKGQTQSSLPLASGKAMMEVVPEPPFRIPSDVFELSAVRDLESAGHAFEDILAGMLATVSEAGMDLKKFNAALKKSGVGMAIEARKS